MVGDQDSVTDSESRLLCRTAARTEESDEQSRERERRSRADLKWTVCRRRPATSGVQNKIPQMTVSNPVAHRPNKVGRQISEVASGW